jgi:hypothetical protein
MYISIYFIHIYSPDTGPWSAICIYIYVHVYTDSKVQKKSLEAKLKP